MSSAPADLALDRQAIADVIARNAYALDANDWDALRECYTPDVETSSRQAPLLGFDAFRAKVHATLGPLTVSQHLIGGSTIEVDGDRATSVSMFQAQHVLAGCPGGDQHIVSGRYVDDWVRAGDGWRIRRRQLIVMWTRGNPDVLKRS